MEHDTDVLVLGGGPAGLTAGIYAVRSGLRARVLVGIEQPGGALTTTTAVDNFPGFPGGVQGPELMAAMQEQAEALGVDVAYCTAVGVDLLSPVKSALDEEGGVHRARAVVVATGAAHRHLGVPGEHLPGVSYCATCDGMFFAPRPGQKPGTVVVVGGGDTACEEALFLAGLGCRVVVLVRGQAMRASAAMAQRVQAAGIEVRHGLQVARILGQDKVEGVELADGTSMPAAAVFVAIGHTPRTDLFDDQLALDRDGYVLTAPTGALGDGAVTRTSVPGVFAAGDVADRRYRQAITSAASGCQAALDAYAWLRRV